MDENNEMLSYIHKNSEMGVYSCTKLINDINGKENKIKKVVEGILKGYENYLKKCEKYVKKYNADIKNSTVWAKMSTSMGISMEVLKDNSDAAISKLLTQGLTMGIVDITAKIDRFKGDADRKILNLAKEYMKWQQEAINYLKPYL